MVVSKGPSSLGPIERYANWPTISKISNAKILNMEVSTVRTHSLSHEWLSNAIRDALDGVVASPTPLLAGTALLTDDRVLPKRKISRPLLAVSLGAVVVGAPSIAFAAGAFNTGPTKIMTTNSIPAHTSGAYPCPSMDPPPKTFSVPPPPKTPEVRTTSLANAASLTKLSLFGFDHSQAQLNRVELQGPTSYQFCHFTITEYPTVILSYGSSSFGQMTLDEISDVASSGSDQATQTPGGGLKTLTIGSLQFIVAYMPSGLVDQASFASEGTQVVVKFSVPQTTSSIDSLLSNIQQLLT